jgi:DNA excision repair protein ERCC-2
MDFFPYTLRPYQRDIMDNITMSLRQRQPFIFESGTGSGKTVCTLAATLNYALENNKRIIYTTRTNAQQQQVIRELRTIRTHTKDTRLIGVGLQGRANLCLLARTDPETEHATADELSRFCAHNKKLTHTTKDKGCPYYRRLLDQTTTVDTLLTWTKNHLPTAEEFCTSCHDAQLCPYEVNKLLIPNALLVVVPYVYVFDKTIRIKLFDWLAAAEDDILLIVDEAHNLPDYLRDLYSAQMSTYMLTSCQSELERYGDPSLADGRVPTSLLCRTLLDIIADLRDTYVYNLMEGEVRTNLEKTDAFIPSYEVETELLSRLTITSHTLAAITHDLIAYGEKVQEYRQKQGKLPRSYIHKLGIFLQFWTNVEMDQYIKLVVDANQGKNPRIEAYCLDPSVGSSVFAEVYSSIHMSGTLEPLTEYRDSLGLPPTAPLAHYPSPFPRDHRLILYTRDVTTRYEDLTKDPSTLPRLWDHITSICNTFPKNTAVFFPSFNTMTTFRKNGTYPGMTRHLYIEDQEMGQGALMNLVTKFRASSTNQGAALFSVMGGRISEGMDFPAEQLELAVIVGIPYPKPSARQRGLQQYYETKFGKGFEYTVHAPAARKLLQAIGRLIRDEHDHGVAIILDKRAPRFHEFLPEMTETTNPIADIHTFMNAVPPRSAQKTQKPVHAHTTPPKPAQKTQKSVQAHTSPHGKSRTR